MVILVFIQTMVSKIEDGNPAIEEAEKVKKDDGIEEIRAIKERTQKIEVELVKIMETLTLKNHEQQEKKSKLIPVVLVLILINILILDILTLPGNLDITSI